MRAAVFHGAGDIRIEDVPLPEPGPGQVAVDPVHNGLCGSDLHEYLSGPHVIPTTPHPLTGARLPVVMGHEFAGTVTAVFDAGADLAVGDRVSIEPLYRCGRCPRCQAGTYNLCKDVAFHGLSAPGGGLAERTVVPASLAHPIPDAVTFELGALVEPMAVAHHAVERSQIAVGEPAVVFGAGAIGIGVWFALQAAGAEPIVAFESSPVRRTALERLGADPVIDPDAVDVTSEVRALTDGEGAAVAIDAAGVPATAVMTLRVLRPRGRAVSVAVYGTRLELNPDLLLRETTWTGSLGYTSADFTAVIDRMAKGSIRANGWVEHVELEELTNGLDAMASGRTTKILIDTGATNRPSSTSSAPSSRRFSRPTGPGHRQ